MAEVDRLVVEKAFSWVEQNPELAAHLGGIAINLSGQSLCDESFFDFLVEHFYKGRNVKFNACHPRDLIDQIIDAAHYHGRPPVMDRDSISDAWDNYFVEI